MDNKELLEKFKMNVAINNAKQEITREHTLKFNKIGGYIMKKKIVAGLCTGLLLISGVALATNKEKITQIFSLGKGIDKAIENGYIAEPEMDNVEYNSQITDVLKGEIIEDINVATKVNDFLMDDLNISTHFSIEIDETINEFVDLDDIKSIELKDLLVTDENNNILYCLSKEKFENYCIENDLDYKYGKFNGCYYNCGLNSFIERKDKKNGTINLTYNMYTTDKSFPKSKMLKFNFSTITLEKYDYLENKDSIVNIKGNWIMNVDVPEEMYNRETISYKVVKCEEKDFTITNATLSNTGFELGIIISNIERPEEPQIMKDLHKLQQDGIIDTDEVNRRMNEDEELRKATYDFFKALKPIATLEYKWDEDGNILKYGSYIENENGEKFECSTRPGRRQDSNFIEGNKFSFYETFEFTTYDATDKLKAIIIYKDNPVVIELERLY